MTVYQHLGIYDIADKWFQNIPRGIIFSRLTSSARKTDEKVLRLAQPVAAPKENPRLDSVLHLCQGYPLHPTFYVDIGIIVSVVLYPPDLA